MIPEPGGPPALYSRAFALLCGATFCFYLSFQMLLPVVPLHALRLGVREADVGLIIGVFAVAAMLPRPVAGWLADRIGRRPLVVAGSLVFAAASLGYLVVGGLASLLWLRAFHGIGMGLGPTAGTVVVADLAPAERRGQAMGVYGTMSSLAMAIGPYLAAELHDRSGAPVTFLLSAAIGLGSVILSRLLPETRPADRWTPASASPPTARPPGEPSRPPAAALDRADHPGPWLARWFSAAALFPSFLLFTLFLSYGGMMAFLPIFARARNLGNPGLFFTVYAVAVIVVRWRSGHLADRYGRRAVAAPGLALAGAALPVLALATSPASLLAAGALYGIGYGVSQPALLAMTVDRVGPGERGRAMGTLYTAWELGIACGAVLLGLLAERLGYPAMWWAAAAVLWLGALAATHDIGRPRG